MTDILLIGGPADGHLERRNTATLPASFHVPRIAVGLGDTHWMRGGVPIDAAGRSVYDSVYKPMDDPPQSPARYKFVGER